MKSRGNIPKTGSGQSSTRSLTGGRGIYTLVLKLDVGRKIAVGSLGEIEFTRGYYAYTGSARGPGGFKRVERHKQVISGLSTVRRWHIDYLMPHTSLEGVVATETSLDLECKIALGIGELLEPVIGFGSTDCSCPGHLHRSDDMARTVNAVKRAHTRAQQGGALQLEQC